MAKSVAEVAGNNARTLRRDTGATLEDVTRAIRSCGLRWSTGSIGDLESGRAAPSVATLFTVAAALGDVIGHPVSLAELFAGDGDVQINDNWSVPLSALRDALSGKPVPRAPKLTGKGGLTTTAVGIHTSRFPKWARDVDVQLVARVLGDFAESDTRMCNRIGVEPDVGAAAMAKLWGRTFVVERDDRAGPDANAQRLGQISRRLRVDLEKIIRKT